MLVIEKSTVFHMIAFTYWSQFLYQSSQFTKFSNSGLKLNPSVAVVTLGINDFCGHLKVLPLMGSAGYLK